MESQDTAETKQAQSQSEVARNVADAHRLLNTLRNRLDRHPELEEAIEKLESALSVLTIKSGGLL